MVGKVFVNFYTRNTYIRRGLGLGLGLGMALQGVQGISTGHGKKGACRLHIGWLTHGILVVWPKMGWSYFFF